MDHRGLSEIVAAILLVFIVSVAGAMVYYSFSYKYSLIHEEVSRERMEVEDALLESESLTILYALLNVSESPSSPPLYVAVGTGLKPPIIGAIYVNGTMIYEGEIRLPSNSIAALRIPTTVNATRGDLVEVVLAGISGVRYHATGYAG